METNLLHPIEDLHAPQFKCIYLPNATYSEEETTPKKVCVFVFVFNHGIIDGMSTMATIRKFRVLLNEVVTGKPLSIDPWSKMHPPCEYFYQRALDALPEEVKKELAEKVPRVNMDDAFFNPKNCLYVERKGTEAKNNPGIPLGQGLTIRTFSEEESKAFRLACRAHKTTIQGAAQVAASAALAKIMQNSDEWETMKIKYNLALNLRPHIAKEVSVDYTGLYIAVLVGFDATIDREINGNSKEMATFWKLAQESTTMMREQVKNQAFLGGYLTFSGIRDEINRLSSKEISPNESESRSEDILYTTSYGPWDFPTQASDKIKPLMVYTNSSVTKCGAVFSQQLISVNGKLSWCIGWSRRVVSKETAEKFANIMFNIVENASKDL